MARLASDSFLRRGRRTGNTRYIMVMVDIVQDGPLNGMYGSVYGLNQEFDIVRVVINLTFLKRSVLVLNDMRNAAILER